MISDFHKSLKENDVLPTEFYYSRGQCTRFKLNSDDKKTCKSHLKYRFTSQEIIYISLSFHCNKIIG